LFYQLIRQELDRQCLLFAEERRRRIELAPQEGASDDESEGYDAERPLGLMISEIGSEESLPEHHIPDQTAIPPDAAISGEELVGILQQEIKDWPADEQQIFELHFLVGFEPHEIAMIRQQTKTQVETAIGTIHSRLRQFMRVSAGL
jgi:DNA-directed RNA polymerase specialized sigma24 family protein